MDKVWKSNVGERGKWIKCGRVMRERGGNG